MAYGIINSIFTPPFFQIIYVGVDKNTIPVALLTSGVRVCSPICGAGAVEYM